MLRLDRIGWPPYAHPDTNEISKPQRIRNRSNSLVSAIPSAGLDADATQGQVKIIVEDDHVCRVGIVSFQKGGEDLSTPIHVCLGFHKGHPMGFHLDFARERFYAFFFPGATCFRSEIVRHPEAQIVSLTGIFSTRIPQTDCENVSPPWAAQHLSISPLF
jgi:hypothetical protein